jgi:hypothetical protein
MPPLKSIQDVNLILNTRCNDFGNNMIENKCNTTKFKIEISIYFYKNEIQKSKLNKWKTIASLSKSTERCYVLFL